MTEQTEINHLDAKFFTEVLNENRQTIKAHVKQAIMDGITRKMSWELPDVINADVSKFIKEEISPEIHKQLLNDKDLIVETTMEVVKGVSIEIAKAMQTQVAKNLSQSWNLKKIAEAILG